MEPKKNYIKKSKLVLAPQMGQGIQEISFFEIEWEPFQYLHGCNWNYGDTEVKWTQRCDVRCWCDGSGEFAAVSSTKLS